MKLQAALLRLAKGGPEQRAVEAGEIDAVVDYASSNVILLPAARRALANRKAADKAPPANGLLAALPRQDYQRLLPDLEPVVLSCGETLHEPGARIRDVYFPLDSQVCLLMVERGKAIEVGLVGLEGMVGMALALGGEESPVRALVQGTGTALRMKANVFHEALAGCPSLQRELNRYACAKLLQARQTAACNRFHQVEGRLARWLLMTQDRVRSGRFRLTHEFLAEVLGVRRVGVTEAASRLQRDKLISYRRGEIRILDRDGLRAAACPCYDVVRKLAG